MYRDIYVALHLKDDINAAVCQLISLPHYGEKTPRPPRARNYGKMDV